MTDLAFGTWGRHPVPDRTRRVGGRRASVVLLALAILVAASAGLILVRAFPREPAAPTVRAAPVAPTWLDIPRPVQIFSLQAPVFADAPVVYTARRRSVGGGREDDLALGTLGAAKPALRLRIARAGSSPLAKPPLYAVLAVRAADAERSIDRVGLPDLLRTRFGAFEVADVVLAAPTAQGQETPCRGFRLVADEPGLAISGLACGGPRSMDLKQLGCVLERLDLASGGEDRALIDFFARSELRRDASCAGTRLAPDTVHAAWLDDKPRPAMPPARRRAHRR